MSDKSKLQKYGPRLVIECSADFKAKVEQTAKERGFSNYKNYIIAVINNDFDRLTKPVKEKKPE